jgi:hypothetical protein
MDLIAGTMFSWLLYVVLLLEEVTLDPGSREELQISFCCPGLVRLGK